MKTTFIRSFLLKILFGVVAFTIAISVNGCNQSETPGTKSDYKDNSEVFPVEVKPVERVEWIDDILAYGTIKVYDKVDIVSTLPGNLARLLCKEGQRVQKDEVVAIVERDEIGSTFKPVEIKATVAGTIETIHMKEGAKVLPMTPIVSITRQEKTILSVSMFETELAKVRVDQKAFIEMDAFPNRQFTGKVSYINPNIQTQSGKGEVEITFDKNSPEVLSGMFGRARIIISRRMTLAIVPEALKKREGKNAVYVVNNGAARLTFIEIGSQKADVIEVKNGINIGDTVITFASDELKDSARVKIAGGYQQ